MAKDRKARGLKLNVPEATALIRDPAGAWRTAGVGEVQVFRRGSLAGLDALP